MPPSFVTARPAPPRLQTSFWGVIGALLALGCGTARIEAVVSDDVTSSGGSPPTTADDASCHEPAAGTFVIEAEVGCLARGAATTVFGTPALTVDLLVDCKSTAAQWKLTPAGGGTFTVRNTETNLLLDARAGSDLPGTPLVLYDANMLDNQRFWFRPRAAQAYELSPRHASTLCAEARGTGVELWSCEPETSSQDFALVRSECP
jgi:hypothetical protein